MSSSRDGVTPENLASGGPSVADEGIQLLVRGRSFFRSPPSAEIEPAGSSAPAPAVPNWDAGLYSVAEPQGSPFANEMSAQEPEPAGLELQPMLSGTAADSSAPVAGSEPQPSPLPLSTASAAVGWSSGPAAPPLRSVGPAGPAGAKQAPSAQAAPAKRDWHAAIRQRLKLRVRHHSTGCAASAS